MKRLFLICLSFLFLITACTQYEVRNTINPEITIIGDKVGVSYMLGPIKVNDTLHDVSQEGIKYFRENKSNIKMDLFIQYNDGQNQDAIFKYYVKGILMGENRNVVKSDILLNHRDVIEGFTLIELNGNVPSSQVNNLKAEPVKAKAKESNPEPSTFKSI